MSALDWTVAQLAGGRNLPGRLPESEGVSERTLSRMLRIMGREWRTSAEIGWLLKCHTSSANRMLRIAIKRGQVARMDPVGRKPQYRRI